MSWIVLLDVLVVAALVWLILRWAADTGSRQQARRWARVAQRRAPVRGRETPYAGVVRHLDEQIGVLLTERRRIEALLTRGRNLRGMMQRSPQLRLRVPSVDRVLDYLTDKGQRIDALMGRYYQHRDNLKILMAAEDFNRDLEAYEAGSSATDPYGPFEVETEALDEETERLLAVAEAEAELNTMLRTG